MFIGESFGALHSHTWSSRSTYLPLGIRLLVASEGYYHILSKKKASDSLMETTEKLLPIDTLGLVMISHGEEFGQDSSFGAFLRIDHSK